jgi:hypothetical protein
VPFIATHLTRSSDGKFFFVDSTIGVQHIFGTISVANGAYEEWQRFERCYNHAQFSPTDRDRVLFAQEIHDDPLTGLSYPITNRLWLLQRGVKPRSILREPRWVSHEWWDADGQHVWCTYGNETWRVDVESGVEEKITFPHSCWHAHSSKGGEYIVCDSNSGFGRGCASSVHFLNRTTGKSMKLIENPERTDYAGRYYHIDPHPRFCCGDQYVVFTTTVRGEIDVAIAPTQALIDQTR